MWLILSFLSATLLGLYDTCKKRALSGNGIFTLLFVNTLLCSLIFLPFIVISYTSNALDGSIFHVEQGGWETHKYIILKSLIVLSSWMFGYAGMKNLPLSITGPINATRPVMVLIGAIFVFGERLNLFKAVENAVGALFLIPAVVDNAVVGNGNNIVPRVIVKL